MVNLRWGKRFHTELKAQFGVEKCSTTGLIDDLSVFGFFLRSSYSYPPSTLLKIKIFDPQGRVISLEGTVQWTQSRKKFLCWVAKESGMGIQIRRFLSGQEAYDNICQQLCLIEGEKESRNLRTGRGS